MIALRNVNHYGVKLHNFTPNAISQAAVFVAVCEGYLGIEVHWDLWITCSAANSSSRAGGANRGGSAAPAA